jgi:hypothetical protein
LFCAVLLVFIGAVAFFVLGVVLVVTDDNTKTSLRIHGRSRLFGAAIHSRAQLPGSAFHSRSRLFGAAIHSRAQLPGSAFHSRSRLPGAAFHGRSRLFGAAIQRRALPTSGASYAVRRPGRRRVLRVLAPLGLLRRGGGPASSPRASMPVSDGAGYPLESR